MIVQALIFICGVIFKTAAKNDSPDPNQKDRSVKLALETVIEFSNQDFVNDNLIKTISKFVSKVKPESNQNPKSNLLRTDFDDGNEEKFTDFVQNALEILNKYNDIDLEQFLTIFNDEVRKYSNKNDKYKELANNFDFKTLVAYALDVVKKKPVEDIRRYLTSISSKIEEEKYNVIEKEIVDFINSLYKKRNSEKFKNFLLNIDAYRLKTRKNIDLTKVINEGIRSIIFDHYRKLNRNTRKAMKTNMNVFLRKYNESMQLTNISTPSSSTIRDFTSQDVEHTIKTVKYDDLKQERVVDTQSLVYNPSTYKNLTSNLKNSDIYNKYNIKKDEMEEAKAIVEDFDRLIKLRISKYVTKKNKERKIMRRMLEGIKELKYSPHEKNNADSNSKVKLTMKSIDKKAIIKPSLQTNVIKEFTLKTTPKIKISWDERNKSLDLEMNKIFDSDTQESKLIDNIKPNNPWRMVDADKFKYEVQFKPGYHFREPQLHLKKPEFVLKVPKVHLKKPSIGQSTAYVPTPH